MLDFLFPEWMDSVMQESDKEAKEELEWPTLLLQNNTRKLIWKMSAALGVNEKGVPGSACRLMEKYLPRYIKQFIHLYGSDEWQRHRIYIEERFVLYLMSCIQLSAKMYITSANFNLTTIRFVLLKHGYIYTENQIRDAEFHVFKTIGFILPKWTNMDTAQFLLKMIDVVDPKLLEAVELVTNITDFNIISMETDIQTANGQNPMVISYHKKSMLNVHICAGAVVASLSYMSALSEEHTIELAKLTQTTTAYINAISDAIIKLLNTPDEEDQSLSASKTRKRSHD